MPAKSLPNSQIQKEAQYANQVDQRGIDQYKSVDDVHLQQIMKQQYPVGDEYILLKEMGQGSYGTVVLAKHIPTGKNVAIKKVSNIFNNETDTKRLLREILILRQMDRHNNVVKLYDVIEPTY